MKQAELVRLYNKKDSAGIRMGGRALRGLSLEELESTARTITKYTNRKYRELIRSGIASEAALSYAHNSGEVDLNALSKKRKEATARNASNKWPEKRKEAQQKKIEERYYDGLLQGTHKIKKGQSREYYLGKIADAMGFMGAKTNTKKRAIESEKKRMATVKETYGLDMSKWENWKRRSFFEKVHELASTRPQFGSVWYSRSPDVVYDIVNEIDGDLDYWESMEKLDELANKYEDKSAEGLAKLEMSSAFENKFPSFEELQKQLEEKMKKL